MLINPVKVEHFFLVLSLIFGLIFAIFNPPLNVNDEMTHVIKAYDISKQGV
jgi:hypothetical protein